jgi:hypothetical protein
MAAAVLSSVMELLLMGKAVVVAIWAPDMVLPSPAAPGVSGLLCSYVAITTSLCSSLVTGGSSAEGGGAATAPAV